MTTEGHDRDGGFTLIELLVALTLFSLLMTAVFGGLSFGARIWQRGGERLENVSQVQAVHRFLHQRLEDALPLDDRRDRPLFKGERTGIRLASTMPESLGDGVFLLDLGLRARDGGAPIRDLILRWRPLEPSLSSEGGERVILEDVSELTIGYFGESRRAAARGWHGRWQNEPSLPELVRIDLQFPRGDPRRWLPFAASPMVDERYDPAF